VTLEKELKRRAIFDDDESINRSSSHTHTHTHNTHTYTRGQTEQKKRKKKAKVVAVGPPGVFGKKRPTTMDRFLFFRSLVNPAGLTEETHTHKRRVTKRVNRAPARTVHVSCMCPFRGEAKSPKD
jgi:ribosomal protein S18